MIYFNLILLLDASSLSVSSAFMNEHLSEARTMLYAGVLRNPTSSLSFLSLSNPLEGPGFKSRMCPTYPQRVVKGDKLGWCVGITV